LHKLLLSNGKNVLGGTSDEAGIGGSGKPLMVDTNRGFSQSNDGDVFRVIMVSRIYWVVRTGPGADIYLAQRSHGGNSIDQQQHQLMKQVMAGCVVRGIFFIRTTRDVTGNPW
jgi:hypothetical protein